MATLRSDLTRIEGTRQRELSQVNMKNDREAQVTRKKIRYIEEHLNARFKVTRVLEVQAKLSEK